MYLTTTRSTKIDAVEQFNVPDSVASELDETTTDQSEITEGEIMGVEVVERRRCRRCHKRQENFKKTSVTHRCECCKLLQKSESYAFIIRGTVVVSSASTEATLTLTSAVMLHYLQQRKLEHLAQDTCALEEHLLASGPFKVSYNEGMVVNSIHDSASTSQSCQSTEEPSATVTAGEEELIDFEGAGATG